VLGLGSLLGSLLGLGGRSSLGLSGLLGLSLLGLGSSLGGYIGEGRDLEKVILGLDSVEDGLGRDGLEPAGYVGVLLSPLLAEEELEATGNDSGSEEVSEGDALANEVGVVEEVLLDNGDSPKSLLGRLLNGLLVVGVLANEGSEPATDRRKDLGVEEREPLQDRGIAVWEEKERSAT